MKNCRECKYHKEKWGETIENGKPLIYLEKVYCPLNECMYSDYTDSNDLAKLDVCEG